MPTDLGSKRVACDHPTGAARDAREPARTPALHQKPTLHKTRCLFRLSAALGFCVTIASTVTANGRDILRPGSGSIPSAQGIATGASSGAVATQARANALDAMARTTRAIQSVQAMQTAARAAAIAGPNNLGVNPNNPAVQLPNVTNGLSSGGLEIATGATAGSKLWQGANLPVQSVAGGQTTVNVKQTSQQAILNWNKFSVGKQTTLNFDQSAGGANSGQWIAFNKISDPSGVPSQILGSIQAQGQVYVINQNGIIFGGSSQVNARALVASSLPINDNLIRLGLLNNRDAQFLFSSVAVPGGSDGTPAFIPAPPPGGKIGDVVVKAGAQLNATAAGDGDGGRVMLAGPNVRNEGTISTPGGQTILAAGNQIAIAAHASGDPSLRGLDVWIGQVAAGAGTSTNTGIISTPVGNATMAGRNVNQLGVIDSTTTVSLNGRIDLLASYGAVGNPTFDNSGTNGFGGPPFLFQNTGTVTLGSGSVTRILPDYASTKTVPGSTLPESSQINIQGLAVHFAGDAMLLAPSGHVSVRAGVWPYADADGNGTTLNLDGSEESNLNLFFSGSSQRFLFSSGQIYVDAGALINVAGSTEVSVPLSQNILNVEFRGSELADSPLQRSGLLRAVSLTVDIRNTGVNNGRYWVGTPLGDVTGVAGIIEHNVAQLTVKGGSVAMQAGQSIVVQSGATIDVSGGYFQNEGGLVQTSRLLQNGHLVDIRNAQPDQTYDGVYTGTFSVSHSRWGVTQTFGTPWMLGKHYEQSYTQGADGGSLQLTAPSMAIDGTLLGLTINPPRSRAASPQPSSIAFIVAAEEKFSASPGSLAFVTASPTPPAISFGNQKLTSVPAFSLVNDTPVALPAERTASVVLSPTLLTEGGFGSLNIENYDGTITVPAGVALTAQPRGSISLTGANVAVLGAVTAHGGTLNFKTFAISPSAVAKLPSDIIAPVPDAARGHFTLGTGATLSTTGLVADDRHGSATALSQPLVIDGGKIAIHTFSAALAPGSTVDVSGGAAIAARGAVTFGNAGGISILTGMAPGLNTVIGGQLALGSTLAGFSGKAGGSLTIQASQIQIGGTAGPSGVLLLSPDFFRQGGFTSYAVQGIGAPSNQTAAPGEPANYAPAISIAAGTRIEPVAQTLAALRPQRGATAIQFGPVLRDAGVRQPVSVSFSASGADDPATPDVLEVRGDIVMGKGALISTDAGGKISFKAQTLTMHGSLFAPGGSITLSGSGKFPLVANDANSATAAQPTVIIGSGSVLSAAGTAVATPDPYGRRTGTLLAGGTISVSGNIVASSGAVLDVSGASATFDISPSSLGNVGAIHVPLNSGLTAPLWKLRTVPLISDSNGGTIDLQGSQMLFSDATLLGHAGGATATGGTLSIFSGRFYGATANRTSADTNLVVTQDGVAIAATNPNPRIGVAMLDSTGNALAGMGYFAANRFTNGGFDSLDLGEKFIAGSPISFGGNVDFQGPVSIAARGNFRVAAGGVITANAAVNLTAKYIALGQIFSAPLNPNDTPLPFTQSPAVPSLGYSFAPTGGTGSLTAKAELIDLGTLSLQGISRATLIADGGDIRGNGTVNIAGDLTLRAGQIYPTTLSSLDIFAYDVGAKPGSVTIIGSGSRTSPLSAGGSLRIFASKISQGGTLRAPFGSITLGWDGSDQDTSTVAVDAPVNLVAGSTAIVPITAQVTLQNGSITSVAARNADGSEMLIPFGLSADGNSWIDPRGVNITSGGLAEKRIAIAGTAITTAAGATVDLRGGGDLFAFRFTAGNGGSTDLLGTASGAWSGSAEYQSGTLVTFGGKTWSARVRSTGQSPVVGAYWSQVADSYAILPGYASEVAPYAPFNTGTNAAALAGDPGYVSSSLKIGDRIYLEATPGLTARTYTLLPRRYALLPGAFLVTPTTGRTYGNISLPTGATSVAGYRLNEFSQPQTIPTQRTQFEVASSSVVQSRASYDSYFGNAFLAGAAAQFNIGSVQRLPRDAGYLSFQGNASLQLDGSVLANAAAQGRGAMIDVSSLADIQIIGGTGTVTVGATAVLNAGTLTAWGADSLLIGGLRTRGAGQTSVDVRTGNLTLNNPGGGFSAGEIILVSKAGLTVAAGSSISASSHLSENADTLTVAGDGAMVRVSSDANATFTRTNTTASTSALLTIGAGANLVGAGVTLDSNYGTALDPAAVITARSLDLGSGQISILLGGAASLTGSVVPQHLQLQGPLLRDVQQVSSLTLRSYRTVDVYGAGTFGSATLGKLTIFGGGMRGYNQGTGTAEFSATEISLGNPSNVASLAAPTTVDGTLRLDAGTVRLGQNAFAVGGWQNVIFNAASGVLGDGAGSFSTPGNFTANTPFITGTRGSTQSITAGGALSLQSVAGTSTLIGGLGAGFTFAGASVVENTAIVLPSGQLTLHATGAGQAVSVGGSLNVAGVAQKFYDLTRYPDAGTITLTADSGDVTLQTGASVSVAADAGGGNAGTIKVNATQGAFNINGATLPGSAKPGATSGSFVLDAKTLPSFTDLAAALNDGGFFQQRSLRIRTGDVTVSNTDITVSNPAGKPNVARDFSLSADTGNITLSGTVDASGTTGGKIALIAGGSIVLQSGSLLTAHAADFSSAGKGGDIRIAAGSAINGIASATAKVTMLANSTIDLGVDTLVAGDIATPGSSAFFGRFTGTLELRAPRNGNDVQGDALLGSIRGASSVIVEGYRLYNQTSGLLNNALRTTINTDARNYMNAGYAAMFTKLTTGNPSAAALGSALVISPGVEIYNANGDLTLGTAVTGLNTEDWDLSTFRYGPKLAPGILTLRAKGDIIFNNTLSDGFTPVTASTTNGNSTMWLAPLASAVTANGLPVNAQSWSYHITAGADLSSANVGAVLPGGALAVGKGSVLVGEFYPAIPNTSSTGATAATGSSGTTANSIRITTGAGNRTRFEVVRTGTGDIEIAAGLDVQLRNQFATIYTAGVRIPTATTVFAAGDFVQPIVERTVTTSPSQGDLGVPQQVYSAQWAMAGGEVSIAARGNIGRVTQINGNVVADSTRQLPTNWLYRRGYVDGSGKFGVGGVDNSGTPVTDAAASTAWWIDYSNFFQGIGALGGGDISLAAGANVINADAVIPTNARMPGRDPVTGLNVAPDASKLLEFGGGNLTVKAGGDISGGIYYVEKGAGVLSAGGKITTNASRSPSLVYLGSSSDPLSVVQSNTPAVDDPATWLPTTLFVGKSQFDVSARGDVLLGPVTNPFLLPQGLGNKFWYKTYFNTFSADAGATVASYGGSVTERLAITLPGTPQAQPILEAWLASENVFHGISSGGQASNFQPWIRLAETDVSFFDTQLQVSAPSLRLTAFAGDVNVIGKTTLFPSSTGTLELAASGSIVGLAPTGRSLANGNAVTVWTSASLNLSDANPANAPGIATPVAFQNFAGRDLTTVRASGIDPFGTIDPMYEETGSYTGQAASIVTQQALHATTPLHAGDTNPVRIYAGGGDVSGLTLFTPKATQILAAKDITDVALYIQNIRTGDVSIVAAGRDIIPNNPNAPIRSLANNLSLGNFVGDRSAVTVTGAATNALPGDIQISGPGVLEVLAGHNTDLGTEANLVNGTGVGIASIGNFRNPFLAFNGADVIAFTGVNGSGGRGAALGLAGSSLDLAPFVQSFGTDATFDSAYLQRLGTGTGLAGLTTEQKSIVGLEIFFRELRNAGRNYSTTRSYSSGLSAVDSLLAHNAGTGSIFTRARDIRTSANGSITLGTAGGGVTMAADIFGNPLTPPGIVTEYGGGVSIFTDRSVVIGQARIFTLRGGDVIIWSTNGDIAAGTAPKTVVTAPPTRVSIDVTSADVKTDLGGLATGGGIGVLASVAGVKAGDVDLVAPKGVVDAGDAGIRSTGNLNIAATTVLNASNIQVSGSTSGVSSGPTVAAPNISGLTSASNQGAAQTSSAGDVARGQQRAEQSIAKEEPPSIITIEVLGYGGGEG